MSTFMMPEENEKAPEVEFDVNEALNDLAGNIAKAYHLCIEMSEQAKVIVEKGDHLDVIIGHILKIHLNNMGLATQDAGKFLNLLSGKEVSAQMLVEYMIEQMGDTEEADNFKTLFKALEEKSEEE